MRRDVELTPLSGLAEVQTFLSLLCLAVTDALPDLLVPPPAEQGMYQVSCVQQELHLLWRLEHLLLLLQTGWILPPI